MKRPWWLGLALALLVTGCIHGGYNRAGDLSPSRMYDVANFNGEWKLMPSSRNDGSTRPDEWFLPDAFRIDGDRTTLRIEDDGGVLLSEVAIDSDYRNGSFGSERNDGVRAHWITDRNLQIVKVAGTQSITQSYALANRGRQLVVEVQVERDGSTTTSTRVYRRI